MPAKITAHIRERILDNVVRVGACLLWQSPPTKAGYGLIWIDCLNVQVHRAAYEAFKGPIADGLLVLHRCDNRLCVEPEHLFLGTHLDNTRDMLTKGRANKVSGIEHFNAKLTPEIAAEMRRRFIPYDRRNGSSALAREFGVHQATAHVLLQGKTWKGAV